MIGTLCHPIFRWLFVSHVLSLFGTGLMTVALALLAYRLGGVGAAGGILATVLTLKMIVYVALAPVANSLVERLPVQPLLVALDVLRLFLVGLFVFATEIWQLYALIVPFFVCSAAFTPTFQSTIPSILPARADYSAALSLSRIAYSLESLLSPLAAGLLMTVISRELLFAVAAAAFAGSAAAVLTPRVPARASQHRSESFGQRLSKGFRIYLQTPRLIGMLVVTFGLALPVGWMLVNSVVYAAVSFGDDGAAYAAMMASYGGGAVAAAFAVPAILRCASERSVMIAGTLALGIIPLFAWVSPSYPIVLVIWAAMGAASSLVLTPGGLLLKRSAREADRPAIFAAHFSLSHAAWLLAYPLAGALASWIGLLNAFYWLAAGAILVALLALRIWPASDPLSREHTHRSLPVDHPHSSDGTDIQVVEGLGVTHSHRYYIDDLHRRWTTE